ncbi:MAG: HAD-IIA family hydrolase [Christensenellaceae bacterium]
MLRQEIQEKLKSKKVFLLDLDGTVYLDETPIGAMRHTLSALRRHATLVFLTNNSSKTEEEYIRKLKRIGLYDERDIVYTSAMAAREYLLAHYADRSVYIVATDSVKASFEGVLQSETDPQVVLLAYDTSIDFGKFVKLNEAIVKGAVYIATHPDAVCPAKGVFPPDVGAFISLLKTSSGREPDVICGKPNRTMGDCILSRLNVEPKDVVMVGDRLHTDIRFGNNCGFDTLLVLSGETSEEMLRDSPDRPSFVLDSLNDAVCE